MKRRVCESCLYFESAGFNRNGWCHHPSRRQNSDVRLMVRSNELGCRNGWNADLWVPAATDEGTSERHQPHDSIGGRARAEVEPAQQNDLITSIVAAKTDNVLLPAERPALTTQPRPIFEEDIFVKQTPSLTWSTGPVSTQPASELVQDPKAAILRARDQFRQRRKTEGRLADRQIATPSVPLLASSREARLASDFDRAEPEPVTEPVDPRYENRPLLQPSSVDSYEDHRPVSPVTLREIDRPFPSMTDFPEDRARFESVPAFEAVGIEDTLIDLEPDDTWIETRQIDTVPPEPYEVDELFEEDELVAYAEAVPYEDEEFSVRHRESILNRYFRQRRERRERELPAEEPFFDEPAHDQAEFVVANPLPNPVVRDVDMHLEAALPDPQPRPEPLERSVRLNHQEQAASSRDARASAWDRGERPVAASPARPRAEPHRPAPSTADFDDDFVLPPPLPEREPKVQAEQASVARSRSHPEPTSPIRRTDPRPARIEQPVADEFGDQPLFAANPQMPADDYEIAPPYTPQSAAAPPSFRMERICQTCRDFRPADNGERGWCNNKWAFNHRRMVDADDLACRNSLGSWWTPKDDVWRRDGDISRHAQQTPRVDQWLFGSASEENDRRRSGS